jgi:hypothetical protein
MLVESQIKPGVDLTTLAPQWAIAYPIIRDCFQNRGYSCVVTNGNERTPAQLAKTPTTLHPSGKALDFRTRHIPMMDKVPIVNDITHALGAQWDVVLENVGQDQEHVHIEFQPKQEAV